MKLNAITKHLLAAASFAAQSLKTRTPLPILSFLLVKPVENGLRFYGTNLEITTSQFCPADVDGTEPFCVPATLFINLLSSATGEDAQITVEDGKVIVEIEMLKVKLGTMETEEFPSIQAVTGVSLEFKASDLESHLSRVAWSVASDNLNRATLCGVSLRIGGGQARFAATNGKSLAVSTQEMEGEGEFIIPSPIIAIVAAGCDHCQNPVKVTGSERSIQFDFGDREVTGKLIEGKYPNYEQYMKSTGDFRAEVGRKELLGVMRRVKLFSTDANFGAVFDFNCTLTVTTENAINSFRESIACKSPVPLKIKLNQEDVLNIASRVSSDAVNIEGNDKLSHVLVRDGNFTAVSMPLIMA